MHLAFWVQPEKTNNKKKKGPKIKFHSVSIRQSKSQLFFYSLFSFAQRQLTSLQQLNSHSKTTFNPERTLKDK